MKLETCRVDADVNGRHNLYSIATSRDRRAFPPLKPLRGQPAADARHVSRLSGGCHPQRRPYRTLNGEAVALVGLNHFKVPVAALSSPIPRYGRRLRHHPFFGDPILKRALCTAALDPTLLKQAADYPASRRKFKSPYPTSTPKLLH